MTECTQSSLEFEAHFRRAVVADFQGGTMTSGAGALLLRQVDHRIGFLRRLAGCFTDFRSPWLTEHGVEQMLAQRVYGLALRYEDLNDHDQLRHDPLMNVLAGKREPDQPLAGKSTLCRLERTPATGAERNRHKKIRYDAQAIDQLLLDVFMEAHRDAPEQVVLDLDVTDTPLHGRQEGRFFHGFYDEYCYLPLYIFCGDQLLVARLRQRWPQLKIILRGDSGFCREELMRWCEDNRVDYVFGLARNDRLRRQIGKAMRQAKAQAKRTGRPTRVFTEFGYRTRKSWSRTRRVVAKAEQIEGKENPRYVVTSLVGSAFRPRALYKVVVPAKGRSYFLPNFVGNPLIVDAESVGLGKRLLEPDRNNYAPRIGLAYQPFGSGKTVLRAACGIFYTPPSGFLNFQTSTGPPYNTSYSYSRPTAIDAGGRAPFFDNPVATGGASSNLLVTVNSIARDYRDLYSQVWSFTIEQGLRQDLSLRLPYVGNRGTRLCRQVYANACLPGLVACEARAADQNPRAAVNFSVTGGGIQTVGRSICHSMQVEVEKRYSDNLFFNGNYTFGRVIALTGNPANPIGNASLDRGRDATSITGVFHFNAVWDLPVGPEQRFLGGHEGSCCESRRRLATGGADPYSDGTAVHRDRARGGHRHRLGRESCEPHRRRAALTGSREERLAD